MQVVRVNRGVSMGELHKSYGDINKEIQDVLQSSCTVH